MKNLVCAVCLSLALGCTTAIVRPYVGEQQAWPTASGSIVNVRYDLPVFTSLPPAPYDVIAEMRIDSPLYAQPEEHHLGLLVKKAMQLGADALVFVEGSAYFSTTYGTRSADAATNVKQASITQVNRFNPESFGAGVNVIAIRWVDDPPPGLPARYARYSSKLLKSDPSLSAPAPAAAPVAPAAPATGTTKPAVQSSPTSSAAPAATPALPEPPKAEAVTNTSSGPFDAPKMNPATPAP